MNARTHFCSFDKIVHSIVALIFINDIVENRCLYLYLKIINRYLVPTTIIIVCTPSSDKKHQNRNVVSCVFIIYMHCVLCKHSF